MFFVKRDDEKVFNCCLMCYNVNWVIMDIRVLFSGLVDCEFIVEVCIKKFRVLVNVIVMVD